MRATARGFSSLSIAFMKITSKGLSDVGLAREHNEDSFEISEDFQLFIVADGMGGHRAGDVASQMATESMLAFFRATQAEDTTWPFHFDPTMSVDENRLMTSIKVANRKIYETSVRNREVRGMGTTVVSAVLSRRRPRVYVAHVGDSRCYRIRGGQIKQLTRDHSLLNDYLLFMPEMTRERQDEIPKNVITRALGMQDAVVVDLLSEVTENGDRVPPVLRRIERDAHRRGDPRDRPRRGRRSRVRFEGAHP
jgi:serine/threonine protein phosphatase PrpC